MLQDFRLLSYPSRRGVLLGLATSGIAWAGRSRAEGNLSEADRAFLAWDVQIEIQQQDMGRLGERRGQTAEVRELGAYLINQHQQSQAELRRIADRLGVRLSEALSPTHLRIQQHYAAVSAESFDQAFVQHEVGDYRYFLRHFEAAAHTANTDVRRYVETELPRLHDGQKKVEALATKIGSGQ
jgi:predicted outer membrane protein